MAEKTPFQIVGEDVAKAIPSDKSFMENFVRGIANSVLALIQTQAHVAEKTGTPSIISKDVADRLVNELPKTEGWGGLVGQITAAAPTLLAGGPISGGALAGVMGGATSPVVGGEKQKNFFEEKALQTGLSLGTGLAGGVAGKLVGSLAKPQQVADFNKLVMDASRPPGATEAIKDAGKAGFNQLTKQWDDAWANVVPGMRMNADQRLTQELGSVLSRMKANAASADQIKRIQNMINDKILDPAARAQTGPGNSLAGQAAQDVQSELFALAKSNKKLSAPILEVRQAVLSSIERSSPPDVAKQFKALREAYPSYLTVQDARKVAFKRNPESHFLPEELAGSATKIAANSGRTASGKAPLAEDIIAGMEQRVGKPGAIVEMAGGLPIAQGISRMAERSPAVRAAASTVQAISPAIGGGVGADIARSGTVSQTDYPGRWEGGDIPTFDSPNFDQLVSPDSNETQGYQDFLNRYDLGSPIEKKPFDKAPTDDELHKLYQKYFDQSNIDRIHASILQQESGGNHFRGGRVLASVNGAVGVGQIMPATFRRYAQPGENITNERDNFNVSRRIVESDYYKYGGDPRKVAAAYFSGQPNYRATTADGNGKQTASYVSDVIGRLGKWEDWS